MSLARLQLIQKQLEPQHLRILEIGALDKPTFIRTAFQVEYADYASREVLSLKGSTNPRYAYDQLVDVDWVVPDGHYRDLIPHDFGLVVANHVIEHIADPINWLHELGSLLTPNGWLFLSIPDKRYTFDFLRQEASIIDWIRAHVNRQSKPDFFHLLDHFWHSRPLSAKDAWSNSNLEKWLDHKRFDGKEAIEVAKKHALDTYADVHCYAYTEKSFMKLLADAAEMGLLGFNSIIVEPVALNTNEFHVLLGNFEKSKASQVGLSI